MSADPLGVAWQGIGDPFELGVDPRLMQRKAVKEYAGIAGRSAPHLRAIQEVLGQVPAHFEFAGAGAGALGRATLVAGGRRIDLPMEVMPDLFMYGGMKKGMPRAAWGDEILHPLEALARRIRGQPGLQRMALPQQLGFIESAIKGTMQSADHIGFGITRTGGAMHLHRGRSVLFTEGDLFERIVASAEGPSSLFRRPTALYPTWGKAGESPQWTKDMYERLQSLMHLQLDIRSTYPELARAVGQKVWEKKARGVLLPGDTPESLFWLDPQTFKKGGHHLRARQALRASDLSQGVTDDVRFLQTQGIAQRTLHRLRQTRGLPFVRSAEMDTLEAAASSHARLMGMGKELSKGKFHLSQHATMLRLVPKTGSDQHRMAEILGAVFGDSSVYLGSPSGMRFAGINNEWKEVVLPLQGKRIGGKHLGVLNPRLAQAVEAGLGQPGFEAGAQGWVGLSFGDVTKAAQEMGPDWYGPAGGPEGLLGYKVTRTGELKMARRRWRDTITGEMHVGPLQPVPVRMPKGATEITGAQLQKGQLRLQVLDRSQRVTPTVTLGESFLWGSRRGGIQGVMRPPVRWDASRMPMATFVASGLESGGMPLLPQELITTASARAFEQKGQTGVRTLAKAFREQGVSVGVRGHALYLKGKWAQHGPGGLWSGGAYQRALASAATQMGLQTAALEPQTVSPGAYISEIGRRARALGYQVTNDEILKGTQGVLTHGAASKRGGMAHRGQIGRVRMRMDDIRGLHARAHHLGIKGADLARVRSWIQEAGNEVSAASAPWRRYLQALAFATSHDKTNLSGVQPLQEITLEEFQRRFRRVGMPSRGAGLDFLEGTPYFQGGGLTDQPLLVRLPGTVRVPYRRQEGTKGVLADYVVLGSGAQLEQQEGMPLAFRGQVARTKKMGKLPGRGYGLSELELYDALFEGDIDKIERTFGAASLKHRERILGNRGRIRRGVYRPTSSLTATIGTAQGIDVGQVGISLRRLRQMGVSVDEVARIKGVSIKDIRRAGYDLTPDLEAEILGIRSKVHKGKLPSFKLQLKTEPAIDPHHWGAFEVVPIADSRIERIGETQARISTKEMVALNEMDLPRMNRDKDFDMVFALLTRKTKEESVREQAALDVLHKAQMKQKTALKEVMRRHQVTDVRDLFDTQRIIEQADYEKLYAQDAMMARLQEAFPDTPSNVLSERLMLSRAQTATQTPGELTGLMNYHWRRSRHVVLDVLEGKPLESLVRRQGVDLTDPYVQRAVQTLQTKSQYASMVLDVEKASTYTVLKKGAAESTLQGKKVGQAIAEMADPQLQAARLIAARTAPGDRSAIKGLTNQILDTLGKAQGFPLEVHTQAKYGRASPALMQHEARQIALTLQSADMLTMGFGSQGQEIGMYSSMELLLKRQGTTAVQATRSLTEEVLMAGIGGWAGTEVPDAFSATGSAGIVEDLTREAATPRRAVSQKALELMDLGKVAAQKVMASKWGKIAIGAGALFTAIGIGRSAFGGRESTPGAPMPPLPLTDQPEGPDLDFSSLPVMDYARMERVPGVRTHLQVTGNAPSRDLSFINMMEGSFGRLGLQPRQSGFVATDQDSPTYRHQLDAEIRNRMYSAF